MNIDGYYDHNERRRQHDAQSEIRAITAVAEHFVRNESISGADALLKAIDLVRSVRTVPA